MRTLAFILFLFVSNLLIGQNYGNIWCFGDSIMLDFNSCTPTVTSSTNDGFEGCSTISDSLGSLLFYTNGRTIWDATHNYMLNSVPSFNSGTLSQCLIIQKPQSNSDFYVFFPEVQALQGFNFVYQVVDMTQNGGLGSIVSADVIIDTNRITEQVAATMHANGTDIWVMIHGYKTNEFRAYLVSSSGIASSPIISSVGSGHTSVFSNINARGNIKFSPDGTKIAFNANGVGANIASNLLELFDFDNSTGIVTNQIKLPFLRGEFGLSFSPDNSKLYCSTWNVFGNTIDSNYLYQFDLSSGDSNTIVNSQTVIHSTTLSESFGSVKIGPDGKIYVARAYTNFLGVINNPNQPGIFCNYIHNGLNLNEKLCEYGLNNYIEYSNYCTVGIDELESSFISIHPNPTTGAITIKLNEPKSGVIRVLNTFGQLVMKEEFNNIQELDINLNAPSGIYFLQLESEGEVITKKIMKE